MDRTPPFPILLVEDDPIAAELTRTWLHELGHRVTAVSSPNEALAALARASFGLMITDVHLGERKLDGFELTVAALELQPSLCVLFVSANAWGPSQEEQPDTTFLHKPYRKPELARAIRFACGKQATESPAYA